MRLLHTADWHVGKVLKGRSRLDEHAAVLAELVGLARSERVDAVIVAGDVFDSAVPPPDAQLLVMRALLALAEDGRQVVVIGGNHDNPRLLDVYRLALAGMRIDVIGTIRRPADGGVVSFTARSGDPVRLAALPFLPHRHAIRAVETLIGKPAQHRGSYAGRAAALIEALSRSFREDTVNIIATHCMVPGGTFGGGEREAQSLFPYAVEPAAFPATAQYAALGHLHRRQRLPGPCPIWYAGSPLAVDFGDEAAIPGVLLVDLVPGAPATVREVEISSARRLRTLRGTLADVRALAGTGGDGPAGNGGDGLAGDWLRVVLEEHPRTGMAEEVRRMLPGVLDIDIDKRFRPRTTVRRAEEVAGMRKPGELFRAYLKATGRADEALAELFDRLHDETTSAPDAGDGEGGA